MLTCNKISCKKNDKTLFEEFGITLLEGGVVFIRGNNGSGKTSLLRILANLAEDYQGTIAYHEYDIRSLGDEYNTHVNYLAHNNALKSELSVVDNIAFYAKLSKSEMAIDAAIHYFELDELAETPIYQLSQGQKRKVALARLLACPTDIWLLDEPFSNLDEETKIKVKNMISIRSRDGGIIIITDHNNEQIPNAMEIDIEDYCS
jgi:heme exporter protein A